MKCHICRKGVKGGFASFSWAEKNLFHLGTFSKTVVGAFPTALNLFGLLAESLQPPNFEVLLLPCEAQFVK